MQQRSMSHLGVLNRKLDAGGKRLALHLPLGANSIAQILEIHKTETATENMIHHGCKAHYSRLTHCLFALTAKLSIGPNFEKASWTCASVVPSRMLPAPACEGKRDWRFAKCEITYKQLLGGRNLFITFAAPCVLRRPRAAAPAAAPSLHGRSRTIPVKPRRVG